MGVGFFENAQEVSEYVWQESRVIWYSKIFHVNSVNVFEMWCEQAIAWTIVDHWWVSLAPT